MSSPIAYSSGSLTTDGVIKSGQGVVSYAEAVGGILTLYEGSTSGKLLATIPSSGNISFNTPMQFGSTGLYATISAGAGVVHTA